MVSIRPLGLQPVRRRGPPGRPRPDSRALASGQADLDPPGRDLSVFFLTDEIQLRRADVAVPGELPHLVHGCPVADRVVDRRLAERVDADAPTAQPVRVDAGGAAVLLDEPPGGLAVQVPAIEAAA